MNRPLPDRQTWLENALQGLVFWIGHRRAMYRHYPLAEGALVAEVCNLLCAHLPNGLKLHPEVMYRRILPESTALSQMGPQARADLVVIDSAISGGGRNQNISSQVRIVIEVKRARAGMKLIREDLARLRSVVKASGGQVRGFLIVVSEAGCPHDFVKGGKSLPGLHPIQNAARLEEGSFRVRRTVKASASFSEKASAHYACLVEVFA